MPTKELFQVLKTSKGLSIFELSQKKTVMMIFLRHLGCVFCQEALRDVHKNRLNWEKEGVKVVLVYPASEEDGAPYLSQFNLSNIESIADPECRLYQEFGLAKGNFSQLFGLKTIIRGFELAAKGNLPTLKQVGDGFQMPGIFLIRNGMVRDQYIHESASDRPDYNTLIECCSA